MCGKNFKNKIIPILYFIFKTFISRDFLKLMPAFLNNNQEIPFSNALNAEWKVNNAHIFI
jgi:hypothetical protein